MATDGRVLRYNPPFVDRPEPGRAGRGAGPRGDALRPGPPGPPGGPGPGAWNVACDLAVNPLLLDGRGRPAGRPADARRGDVRRPGAGQGGRGVLRRPGRRAGPARRRRRRSGSPATPTRAGAGRSIDPAAGRPGREPRQSRPSGGSPSPRPSRPPPAGASCPAGLGRAVERRPAPAGRLADASCASSSRPTPGTTTPGPGRTAGSSPRACTCPACTRRNWATWSSPWTRPARSAEQVLGVFAAEANAVLAAYDCAVTVLYHDTEVQKVQTWHVRRRAARPRPGRRRRDVATPACSTGSIASGVDPACVVCLTDLETEFPANVPGRPGPVGRRRPGPRRPRRSAGSCPCPPDPNSERRSP